ncbi:transposase, partial [Ferrimicrobium sp.]
MGETEDQKTRNEKTRRQFDDEFKKDAVRLVESGNLPLRQVAEDLG